MERVSIGPHRPMDAAVAAAYARARELGLGETDTRFMVTDATNKIIDELRAVLAPLLDNPWRDVVVDQGPDYRVETRRECLFCDRPYFTGNEHNDDCPVLRRDELLGRSQSAG